MKPVVAIDGPAGSGKGTLAKKIASYFNFAYLDTGLLYRIIAHMEMQSDEIRQVQIDDLLTLKGMPPDLLRSESTSAKASEIAKMPEIREIMTKLQRDFAASPGDIYMGSVLDGRDIGTVVIPDAACKIFVTANLKVRAMRRFNSLRTTNRQITYEEIYENLEARDKQDQSREIAPLAFNDSYTLIDTSNDTIDESFAKAVKIVKNSLKTTKLI
ncbi:MAG: cytidylate kinase [Holosporaceae bacterium]|jgi:cytidylate kinase|nr:cytidylate kinase [Holosporaceae bacterium]